MPRLLHFPWRLANIWEATAIPVVSALQLSHAFWRRVAKKPGVAAFVHISEVMLVTFSLALNYALLTCEIRERS
jgi:hypothetical protein